MKSTDFHAGDAVRLNLAVVVDYSPLPPTIVPEFQVGCVVVRRPCPLEMIDEYPIRVQWPGHLNDALYAPDELLRVTDDELLLCSLASF